MNTKALEKEVMEIFRIATSYAVDFFDVKDPKGIKKIGFKKFVSKCHEGYDLAQKKVLKHVLRIEKELSKNINKQKEISKGKKKSQLAKDNVYKKLKKEEGVMERNILIFKRILDTIAWTILRMNKVLIRSTKTHQEHHGYLEDKNLQSMLEAIKGFQKSGEFMLMCDLTTCLGAGAGDFVHVGPNTQFKFIELKEGKVNARILKMLEDIRILGKRKQKKLKNCKENFLEEDRAILDKYKDIFLEDKKIKQVKRFFRQQERMTEVMRYERTGVGKDIGLNRKGKSAARHRFSDEVKTIDEFYYERINKIFDNLNDNESGYDLLNYGGFLYFLLTDNVKSLLFKGDKSDFVNLSDAKHIIYHFKEDNFDECVYLDSRPSDLKEKFSQEISSYFTLLIFDWVEQILADSSLMPPFIMGIKPEYIFDLIFKRKSIYVHFDRNRFVDFVNSGELKFLDCQIMEKATGESSGIKYKMFRDSEERAYLGWGTFFRMMMEFQEPITVLNQLAETYRGGKKLFEKRISGISSSDK